MNESRLQTFTHQSPIGHWSVSVWQVDPRLREIVTSLWFGEGKTAYQRDRILPSGNSQLLINLGPPQYRIEPGPPEVRVPFVDVWYSGLHQGPIDTEAPHGNALLGVAFHARGTFPWLGERMDGLSDRIIALADAIGDGALSLREVPEVGQKGRHPYGCRLFLFDENYFPTGTLTPTLTVPPPARTPSLAATVEENVLTIMFT